MKLFSLIDNGAGQLLFAADEEIEQGCFAATVRADDPVKFAGLEGEIDIVQHWSCTVGKRNIPNVEKRGVKSIVTHSFSLFVFA
jgi:hypothetical protein